VDAWVCVFLHKIWPLKWQAYHARLMLDWWARDERWARLIPCWLKTPCSSLNFTQTEEEETCPNWMHKKLQILGCRDHFRSWHKEIRTTVGSDRHVHFEKESYCVMHTLLPSSHNSRKKGKPMKQISFFPSKKFKSIQEASRIITFWRHVSIPI